MAVLSHWASRAPQRPAFTFLVDGESESATVTYARLDRAARQLAARLEQEDLRGERALLLYPPGISFIVAFLGCLYAGVVAVPAHLPRRQRPDERQRSIARDCQPAVGLITARMAARSVELSRTFPEFGAMRWMGEEWLASDPEAEPSGAPWRPPELGPDSLADDDFFELGGDSLIAVRMAAQLNQELEREIPVAEPYQRLTVRALAEFVAEDPSQTDQELAAHLDDRRRSMERRYGLLERRRVRKQENRPREEPR